MSQSEPSPAQMHCLVDDMKVTLWDRWEVMDITIQSTLAQVVTALDKEYLNGKLQPRDMIYGSMPLFMHAFESIMSPGIKTITEFPKMKTTLKEALSLDNEVP